MPSRRWMLVAGNTDAAFDQIEVGGFGVGLEEDDDVAAANIAIVDEGRPERWRRERDAVHQDVVADEQRLLHGRGGNLEVLEDEGHDEEADGEHGADGGERLDEVGLVRAALGWQWGWSSRRGWWLVCRSRFGLRSRRKVQS